VQIGELAVRDEIDDEAVLQLDAIGLHLRDRTESGELQRRDPTWNRGLRAEQGKAPPSRRPPVPQEKGEKRQQKDGAHAQAATDASALMTCSFPSPAAALSMMPSVRFVRVNMRAFAVTSSGSTGRCAPSGGRGCASPGARLVVGQLKGETAVAVQSLHELGAGTTAIADQLVAGDRPLGALLQLNLQRLRQAVGRNARAGARLNQIMLGYLRPGNPARAENAAAAVVP